VKNLPKIIFFNDLEKFFSNLTNLARMLQ